jgi:hypothetical protein
MPHRPTFANRNRNIRVRGTIAGTARDQRCKYATRINHAMTHCINGNPVSATQVDKDVTITCGCNLTYTMTCTPPFTDLDVLANFNDLHPVQE